MARSDSRERMVGTAAALFQRQGYRATSWRQVTDTSGAPWGSVAYLFPGGKEQLGVEAVVHSGARVAELIALVADRAGPDPVAGVRAWIEACAEVLEASGYVEGCPVATVVLEVGADHEPVRLACADAFARWADILAGRLAEQGVGRPRADELATVVLCTLEGALVLARARRDTAPLATVADEIERLLRAELARTQEA
jgi:TetR/AcrR family transcriptional repressor of lmrAB and yxaGH operons